MNGTSLSAGGDKVFTDLNTILMSLPKLEKIVLIGTGIGENLADLLQAFRLPQIKSIDIQYNGITKEYCTAFAKYMFSFANIVELNLGSNWFGV